MIDVSTIKEARWAPDITDPFGKIVTGIDEINQMIDLVLFTPVGAVPGNPEKGSKIDEMLDLPVMEVVPLVVKEIWRTVPKWIPEIELQQVQTKIVGAELIVSIIWKHKGEKTTNTKELSFAKSA